MGDSSKFGRDWRRHHRYRVRDVRGRFPLHFEVEVLNMSLSGLAVECQKPLEIGKEYEFTLHEGDEGVKLRANVEWCRLVRTKPWCGDTVPVFQSGLDFRGALDEQTQELLHFLQHHTVVEAERRIFGRFKLTAAGSAKVTEHHYFLVREISFSGMLIEADLLLGAGSTLDMELHAGRREFRLTGRVANSELLTEVRGESVCRAGIAFEGVDEETARALEEVTKDFLE